MNKSWFSSRRLFDFFKGSANIGKKIYEKRDEGRNVEAEKYDTQYKKETIHDATRFFNLVLRLLSSRFSFYRRCSHRYLHIYRVFGFVLFNLSACGSERIVVSSPHFFIHFSFVLYPSARLQFYIFLEKWKNKRGSRSEIGVRRGKALWKE